MDSRYGREDDEWHQVTGLEESMMRMGLRGAETYPLRHGVLDCDHYIRTGYCSFGSRCRFNHPLDRSMAVSAMQFEGSQYPERPGEPACQFYMKTGTCKFGIYCKFHHPKNEGGSFGQAPLNVLGYPLRTGGIECTYYLKTGQCKFGVTCKFHHPQPSGMSLPTSAPSFYPAVHSASSVPTPEQYSQSSRSYVQRGYGPVLISHGVVPLPAGWTPYSGSVSAVRSTGVESEVVPYPHMLRTFPERPGEPECQYYLRTGDCKYGSSWIQPCKFYVQTGYCKFGSTCKFDHPVDTGYNYIPSSPPSRIQIPQHHHMQSAAPFSTTSDLIPARSESSMS